MDIVKSVASVAIGAFLIDKFAKAKIVTLVDNEMASKALYYGAIGFASAGARWALNKAF